MNTKILGLNGLDVTTEDSATAAIDTISNAIYVLSAMRSQIGAYQNRLEHTIANENNIIENTTAAESRIRDTDMAQEMTRYSLANIISQAATTVLAQANQTPSMVLSLLT